MSHRSITMRLRALGVAVLLGVAGAGATGPAHAGIWVQTNCVNPDGSAAPSDGWTSFTVGTPPIGSEGDTTCGPADPMTAKLAKPFRAPAGSAVVLRYAPPAGSTLIGGTALAGLAADSLGDRAGGVASIHTPVLAHTSALLCATLYAAVKPCPTSVREHYGIVELPRDRGGELFVMASCVGDTDGSCFLGGVKDAWALAGLSWANLRLSSASQPTASGFRGALLEPGAHGTATVAFTAADDGPGIHTATLTIDGRRVYHGTPNTNGGRCAAVGADAGAPMFAWQQPCPRTQTVEIAVDTTLLADGSHELAIALTNAAQNSTPVLRRTITTNNRTTVSSTNASSAAGPPGPAAAQAEHAIVLDGPTRTMLRGVRRSWTRSALRLSGTLRHASGLPATGVLVTLFARNRVGGSTRAIARDTTDAAGHWSVTAPRGQSRVLTIVTGEQPDPASPRAVKVTQTVRPTVSLRVRALGSQRLRFSGRVRMGRHAGLPRFMYIETLNNTTKRWKRLGITVRVRSSGAYRVTYAGGRESRGGRYKFRAVVYPTAGFATGISPVTSATVR